MFRGHADAFIADREGHSGTDARGAQGDVAARRRVVADVLEEDGEQAVDSGGVGEHRELPRAGFDSQVEQSIPHGSPPLALQTEKQLAHHDRLKADGLGAGVGAGNGEQVLDQSANADGFPVELRESLPVLRAVAGPDEGNFNLRLEKRDRGAQFVRGVAGEGADAGEIANLSKNSRKCDQVFKTSS